MLTTEKNIAPRACRGGGGAVKHYAVHMQCVTKKRDKRGVFSVLGALRAWRVKGVKNTNFQEKG